MQILKVPWKERADRVLPFLLLSANWNMLSVVARGRLPCGPQHGSNRFKMIRTGGEAVLVKVLRNAIGSKLLPCEGNTLLSG